MKVAIFDTKPYTRRFFEEANAEHGHQLVFLEPRLSAETSKLAFGYEAICVFVNDRLDKEMVSVLAEHGTRLIALRCSGFNNVDICAALDNGMTVARVPAYSPHAVAEHAVGLILALNRKIYRAYNRVREWNLSLDGLLGFDLNQQIVGVIGTGKIGSIFARIMTGFGCRVLAFDPKPNEECKSLGVEYGSLEDVLKRSDIISLHVPLTRETHHLIGPKSLQTMKEGVMLINTSRGGLVDTPAVIRALKSGKIGYLGLDVYEEEGDLFFEDLSQHVMQDDVFARLLTFPNVIITGHQAFFTVTALRNIASTTLSNITHFTTGDIDPSNLVTRELIRS